MLDDVNNRGTTVVADGGDGGIVSTCIVTTEWMIGNILLSSFFWIGCRRHGHSHFSFRRSRS